MATSKKAQPIKSAPKFEAKAADSSLQLNVHQVGEAEKKRQVGEADKHKKINV
jgi:hypothetical protein